MEIQKDIGAEVIRKLQDVLSGIDRLKSELKNKDNKIAELEAKLGFNK